MSAVTPRGSIRRRLVALLLLGALGLAILAFVVVRSVARQVAQESQDVILLASAQAILESVRVSAGEIVIDMPYSALSMLDSGTDERVFYAIRLDGRFLSGYDDLPPPPDFARQPAVFASARYAGEPVRIASARRGLTMQHGPAMLTVSTAQTLGGLTARMAWISRMALGVGAGFFVLAAISAFVVAGSAIKPLQELAASVGRRGPKDLRPMVAPVPTEMTPLVTALNALMTRLDTSLTQSEDLIAEAAHRVRTPMAIVRTQAEITLRRVEKPENREAVREMIRAIDESSRTAGQLLDHAMVAFRADHLADETVDLRTLVEDAIDRLRPVSELKEIDLAADLADAAGLSGDAILLQSAVRNLLDNAIKYSPEDSRVTLSLKAAADSITLAVRDSGPGFPEDEMEIVTQRFRRGANAQGIVGSGLGLTIAKQVAEAHGGTLTLSNPTGGGACATLRFPLR